MHNAAGAPSFKEMFLIGLGLFGFEAQWLLYSPTICLRSDLFVS